MNKGRFEFTSQELEGMISSFKSAETAINTTSTVATTNNTVLPQAEVATKSNKLCFHSDCKKRLMLSDPVCRCNERFCSIHRMPEVHKCTFDFKAAGRTYLSTMLVKVTGDKVDKI